MTVFEGWYADTTLFGDGHIEFFVYDPEGNKWGQLTEYALFKGETQPYSVPKRKIKKIDKIACKTIARCKKAYDAKRVLAEHVKVEC
jgi:hypothetical protein